MEGKKVKIKNYGDERNGKGKGGIMEIKEEEMLGGEVQKQEQAG